MPTYTQLAVDTFHRANENPITPANWTTPGIALAAYEDLSTDASFSHFAAGSISVF
jgi:hypothetical protein